MIFPAELNRLLCDFSEDATNLLIVCMHEDVPGTVRVFKSFPDIHRLAIAYRCTEFFKTFVETYPLDVNTKRECVFYCCKKRNLTCLKILPNLTADDIVNTNNCALQWAAHHGDLEMTKYLGHGLTVDDLRKNENTVLQWAAASGHVNIIRFLFDKGLTIGDIRANRALEYMAYNGCLDAIKFAVDRGLTVEDIRSNKNRALVLAVDRVHLRVVKYLVQQGLTLDDLATNNYYALRVAAGRGNLHMVQFFVSRGITRSVIRKIVEHPETSGRVAALLSSLL